MHSRLAIGALLLAIAGCGDPVHDRAVDALGPEKPGVPPGPDHRPGQPCLTCHGGQGPSSFVMSFGGTVYTSLSEDTPAGGAMVHVLDDRMRTFDTPTNCVGNFWIPARQFQPVFPAQVAIQWGSATAVMRTEMRLDGSCNSCHVQPESASSPGHVWMLADGVTAPEVSCR